VLTVPNVALGAGQIVTIFAAGKLADSSLTAVPVTYQAAPTMPRAGAAPITGATGALPAANETACGIGAASAQPERGYR
jgi:hypothetical protein